ncbi:unnamed protein product [Schistocephalus solidus]|uniref:CUB domain-containing protein n=1 Tax=Schistocephalus solidus TaxID=70667 RepID=A0A183TQL7_SCHSO|nr:unnamed protein product [Schistocephalus solidus]
MRHAVVLVDEYTLRDSDWSLASVGGGNGAPQGATHCLHIRLPSLLTAGRVFIELETVAHGRLRCPEAFVAVADSSVPGRSFYSARGTGQAMGESEDCYILSTGGPSFIHNAQPPSTPELMCHADGLWDKCVPLKQPKHATHLNESTRPNAAFIFSTGCTPDSWISLLRQVYLVNSHQSI